MACAPSSRRCSSSASCRRPRAVRSSRSRNCGTPTSRRTRGSSPRGRRSRTGRSVLSLADGDLTLELLPDLGAAVATLRYQGRDVLRPTAAGADDPFETSAFALVPYANRIADGRFRVGDREVRIERNAPGQAHPLHGHAWRKPWRDDSSARDHAVLSFEHAADSWPWHHVATQTDRKRTRLNS